MSQLKDRNIVQLLRTSGSTLQLNGDVLTDENGVSLKCEHITIKEGELIIAMDNETPKIYFLKNNGEFAEFIDKQEIITNEFVESRALIDLHNMIAVLKQIVGDGFYDSTLTEKVNNLIKSVESLGGGAITDYVNFLKEWIISDLGQYNNIELFVDDLNSMANEAQKSGIYFATVNNIKCKIIFVSLDDNNESFCQSIEGPIRIETNAISVNNSNKIRTISRIYFNNNWSDWSTLVYNDEIPVCQTDANGNNLNYLYSKSGDTSHEVLSGTFRTFQENGDLKLQHKLWGSQNNYNDKHKHTVVIPMVTDSANGAMDHNVYKRLLNNTISEQNSTTDIVNINYTNFNGNSNTLELTKATTAKAGVMTAEQVNALNSCVTGVNNIAPYITTLQGYIIGELGNYDNSEDFVTALNNMTKDTNQNGRYFAKVNGVPLFVTFELLNNAANILCQWVEGAILIDSNGEISTNVIYGVRIISRIYSDGVWGRWISSALKGDLPTPQEGYRGYKELYIYSHQSDSNRQVLNGNFKVINANNGKVELQHRIWGSIDYTSEVTKYVQFPTVTTSQQGMMDNYVYARLLNHTIQESGSNTNGVVIHYTNFAQSGDRAFAITAASSAKAGVMTTEQYNQLQELSTWLRGSLGTFTSTDAFKTTIANMPTTHKGKYGRYYAILSGVTVYITFVLLEESSNTFAQWVEGTFIKSATDGDIYLNSELGVRLIGRVYHSTAWGLWRSTILDDELPIPATTTNNGLMTSEQVKSLSDIQNNYKDFGHFDNEDLALAKLTDLSVCADSNIVHAHMTYMNSGTKTTLILIQSIIGVECRQIIYNKMKIFHRVITFTDKNRTAISWKEDWGFLFGDRLKWNKDSRKYLLSQFGNNFNSDYTDPIPLADENTDGLMSKQDKSTLEEFNTYGHIGTLSSWNNIAKLTTESTEEDILKTLTITTLDKEVTSTKEKLFAVLDKCAINKKILKESSTNAFVFVEYIGNCYVLQIVGNKAALLNNVIVGTPVIRSITISGLTNETLKVRKAPFEIKLETINMLNTKIVSLETQINELTERITALERA